LAASGIKLEVIQEARICLLAGAAIKDSADPADALVILLSGPLSSFHGRIFNPADMAAKVKEQFGWSISTDALEFLIPKFRQHGWLRSQEKLSTTFGPLVVELPEPERDDTQISTADALSQLGESFLAFADEISPIHVLPKDPLEAGAALLRFVVDAATPIDLAMGRARTEEDYLSARFSETVAREKRPEAALFESLTAVGFLFRVADEIATPSRKRKTDLKVVIDGPVLLDLLGSAGPVRANSVGSLFSTLERLGADFVTFQHNVDEAKAVLSKILRTSARDRYGPTGDALRKGIVHENFLRGLLGAFDLAVRNKKIQILTGDIKAFPQAHQYFDQSKIDALEEVVNWHDEENDVARYRDVDTTALVIRRRAFHRTTDLFDSKFVCVTSNNAFAGVTKRHLVDVNYYNAGQIPPIVTLKELSARAWIEVGVSDAERMSIPRSQLLLTCDRSLRLNRRVVEKAKEHLQKANPDQLRQFELLLELPRSARALMDHTLNDEKYVSAENIELLVESVVDAAGREGAEKERTKRLKETAALKGKLQESEEALANERSARLQREEAHNEHVAIAKERDSATLDACARSISKRFRKAKKGWRLAYFVAAFVPLLAFGFSATDNKPSLLLGIITVFAVLLGIPLAMDRPGAWLTMLIKRHLQDQFESNLCDMGRDNLLELIDLTWDEMGLSWGWSATGLSEDNSSFFTEERP
jgi:hypothetical protein